MDGQSLCRVDGDDRPEAADKQIIRRFVFSNQICENGEDFSVFVSEILRADYGLYTWPCAVVLAQYIWHNKDTFKGSKILELASGTALPGIVAAKCGARVTLTDASNNVQCLENCRQSCLANGLNVDDPDGVGIVGITWGTFEPNLFTNLESIDYVLASDCFYDPNDFEDVLVTVSFILNSNIDCKCLCTYQVRSSDWTIESLLAKWRLQCEHIPLASFDAADTSSLAQSNLPGQHSIQMLKFTKK